jgi:hypothetical protein
MLNTKQTFIIADLDEFHLLIHSHLETWVRNQLETEVSRPVYLGKNTVRSVL